MGSGAWRTFLLAILAAGLSAPALAGPPDPGRMRACAALPDNAARLSCYDDTLAGDGGNRPGLEDEARDDEGLFGDAWGDADNGSLLDSRWELRKASKGGVFHLRPYKPVYLAPVSWASDRNNLPHTPNPETTVTEPQDLDSVEAKFQLSMKFKLAERLFGEDLDLWGAYTQVSRWQVYNTANSRPFRETNYEPELILVKRTSYRLLGWRGRMVGIGLNHQSNGRAAPLSRSWNRIMLLVGLDRDDWAVTVRPWRRIDESRGEDDNPDISDYMGRFDATVVRTIEDHQIALTARHSLKGGDRSHGAVQLEWAFPIRPPLRGRVQLFHGYGESLIDYNFRATWVTLGFSLVEWF